VTEPAGVRIAPAIVFQEVEGEVVLLDLEADRYYSLDEVGTRCWQLLVEHGDWESVVAAMLAEFDVEEATLRSDLAAFRERLQGAGLVAPADAGA
jgi:Coenzyme PQQ synthesis protein D (PqqD)